MELVFAGFAFAAAVGLGLAVYYRTVMTGVSEENEVLRARIEGYRQRYWYENKKH